jgi:peptide-methionine (S)-S-oxide reductase
MKTVFHGISVAAFVSLVACLSAAPADAAEPVVTIPPPAFDEPLQKAQGSETAVLAGGCFWGVQAVFQHVKGVLRATSGYSGGSAATAKYEIVSSGRTGHAESVEVRYDPSLITYGKILQVYFSVAHDPTQLDRQGPDDGPQYRSAIFVKGEPQNEIAQRYVAQLDQAGVFKRPIVTQITRFEAFYPAEEYHQDYATLHPDALYIVYNDAPKIENLKQVFPDLYRATPVLVAASPAN